MSPLTGAPVVAPLRRFRPDFHVDRVAISCANVAPAAGFGRSALGHLRCSALQEAFLGPMSMSMQRPESSGKVDDTTLQFSRGGGCTSNPKRGPAQRLAKRVGLPLDL